MDQDDLDRLNAKLQPVLQFADNQPPPACYKWVQSGRAGSGAGLAVCLIQAEVSACTMQGTLFCWAHTHTYAHP